MSQEARSAEASRREAVPRAAPTAGERHRSVKSSERTLEILETLAASNERRSLSELARMLGVPKSSLHAILRTMHERGWVETDPSGTRFGLGVRALYVGTAYPDSDDVVSVAAQTLDWLVAQLDETVHLGRLDGTDIVYLAKRESSHHLRMFSAIGRRLPAYATALGKALLAALPDDQLAEHLPETLTALTPHTLTDLDALRRDLDRTRRRGYAVDHEESTEGLGCIAVTIPTGEPPRNAISCSVPTVRLRPEQRKIIVEHLLKARERLTVRFHPSQGA
jgi:DNA-binding IclR family transcriptional regulator